MLTLVSWSARAVVQRVCQVDASGRIEARGGRARVFVLALSAVVSIDAVTPEECH